MGAGLIEQLGRFALMLAALALVAFVSGCAPHLTIYCQEGKLIRPGQKPVAAVTLCTTDMRALVPMDP